MNVIDWIATWLLSTASQNFITTTVLVPIVWLACRSFRHRPTVQHLLWLLLLVKFVTPPFPGLAWSIPENLLTPQYTHSQYSTSKLGEADEPRQTDQVFSSDSASTASISVDTSSAIVPLQPAVNITQIVVRITVFVWFLGAMRTLLKHLRSFQKLRRILRSSTAANAEFSLLVNETALRIGAGPLRAVVSSEVASPFVSCTSRVELVWPRSLTEPSCDSFRSLVAHEAAHVRRCDHMVAWIELLATVLWWWNPVFWFIQRQLRATAELACDAIALDAFPDDRCFYAEKLLELSSCSLIEPPPLALAVGEGSISSIERRIAMIVSERVTYKLGAHGLLIAVVIGICAAPGWALTQSGDGDLTSNTGTVARKESSNPTASEASSGASSQDIDLKEKHVVLSDGTKIPLDSQGLLAPQLLGKNYVVGWSSPLTIAESGESIQVRLSEKPLDLDLRKGDGIRQALIRVRSIQSPVVVHLQTFRVPRTDTIGLEIRISEKLDQKGDSKELVSKLTLLTQPSDIEVVSLDDAISIRKITVSEGRTGESVTNQSTPQAKDKR